MKMIGNPLLFLSHDKQILTESFKICRDHISKKLHSVGGTTETSIPVEARNAFAIQRSKSTLGPSQPPIRCRDSARSTALKQLQSQADYTTAFNTQLRKK